MEHLNQEAMIRWIEGRADAAERRAWTQHVLDCPQCALRFKAMHALQSELDTPQTRPVWKPALLAVAAAFLLFWLPVSWRQPDPLPHHPSIAGIQATEATHSSGFDTLERVRMVNDQHAVGEWGQGKDVLELVRMKNCG